MCWKGKKRINTRVDFLDFCKGFASLQSKNCLSYCSGLSYF